ncbi:hypothetical protein SLEP1_g35898 [Rubroshorea leprosula]|uniref:Integrase catalytic domain-containing protein n=1 Tax=Rubroshorea leprosula TaxID=152421 RepID=A0AAV5KQ77_9ROSI|nr:hypothetical protein SLEP1_g35898 [Rubroshorea leprosula]
MEELRQQTQRLQERLEAFEGQQAQHLQDEPHELEEYTDNENPFHHLRDNESSSSTERVRRRRPQRPQQNVAPKSTNLGIKIDIPDFEGRLQLDEFINWLHTIERVFKLKDILDNKRVKLVTIKLKKHASIWVEKQISKKNITSALKSRDFGASQGTQASKTVAKTLAKAEKEVSSSRPAQSNTRKCFKCQGFCHIASNCPNRRAVTIIGGEIHEALKDEVEKEQNDETESPQLEEELIPADHGESLVVHCTKMTYGVMLFPWMLVTCYLVALGNLTERLSMTAMPTPTQFSDVVPDEIPHGLPPMRDIQHAIDFIRGSVIPNKPAYQMNPQEYAELQRQVKELIEKGLVKESVSPCAVPVLLVPKKDGTWRIFHGLASFYRRFIKNFSSIASLITDSIKGDKISWSDKAQKSFEGLKRKLTEAPVLALPNFDLMFEVDCDASNVGIGAVLSQEGQPIAFFSEKFNDTKLRYSTYDKQFYAIVRALEHWITGFEVIKELYKDDPDFSSIWEATSNQAFQQYHCQQDYLFKGNRLCVPCCSLRDSIIWEAHNGGLAGHFGRDKTLALAKENFYWPKLEQNVIRHIQRCKVCHQAETQNTGLYLPLPIPTSPWEDKTNDASLIAELYFREIVRLYGVPKTITSDRDMKFMSHFWRTLWRKMGTQLQFSSASHPQTNGQTKAINKILGNLLRSFVGKNLQQWDLMLAQAEFAYNNYSNQASGKCPFEVVYGVRPLNPLDLAPLPTSRQFSADAEQRAKEIKKLHEEVCEKLQRQTIRYKAHHDKHQRKVVYKEGHWVWIHLRKERFPNQPNAKLSPRADGPS